LVVTSWIVSRLEEGKERKDRKTTPHRNKKGGGGGGGRHIPKAQRFGSVLSFTRGRKRSALLLPFYQKEEGERGSIINAYNARAGLSPPPHGGKRKKKKGSTSSASDKQEKRRKTVHIPPDHPHPRLIRTQVGARWAKSVKPNLLERGEGREKKKAAPSSRDREEKREGTHFAAITLVKYALSGERGKRFPATTRDHRQCKEKRKNKKGHSPYLGALSLSTKKRGDCGRIAWPLIIVPDGEGTPRSPRRPKKEERGGCLRNGQEKKRGRSWIEARLRGIRMQQDKPLLPSSPSGEKKGGRRKERALTACG